MESQQLGRTFGEDEERHNPSLHPVIGGEEHHEKQSIIKKVKDKAKKIKHKIGKKMHGNSHDHNHGEVHENSLSGYEEDDEEDEYEDNPDVHGAPMYESEAARNFMGREEIPAQSRVNLGKTRPIELDPQAQKDWPKVVNPTPSAKSLEEDPDAPKTWPGAIPPSNYEAKVADPTATTGGHEAEVSQLAHAISQNTPHVPQSSDKSQRAKDQSYTNKISSATSAIVDKAVAAKNVVASKLGYGPHDKDGNTGTDTGTGTTDTTANDKFQPSKNGSYIDKISSATSAIADKAVTTKNVIASKLGYGQDDKDAATDTYTDANTGTDTATATYKESSQPLNGHSYTDKISSATSHPKTGTDTDTSDTSSKQSSISEYGHKLGKTVSEKLAPVYGKEAEIGNSVMSKVQGIGSEENKGTDTDDVLVVETEGGVKRSDKGVSVKEFVAERTKPGDDHKALAELISDAIHKRMERPDNGSDQRSVTMTDAGGENGVVGTIKGVVSSMIGMNGESTTTSDNQSQARGQEMQEKRDEQRKLQQHTN